MRVKQRWQSDTMVFMVLNKRPLGPTLSPPHVFCGVGAELQSCWYSSAAVRGCASEGFYKNNSLTDNLLAASLQRLRVPFGEAAFLFQLHTESPESQGWSLWVLIAFFPLICQSVYSDEGKKGMKALQTLMKRSTNSFFFVAFLRSGRRSCGGGRGAWAALCLIGWLRGQPGEFGCFFTEFGENKPVKLVRARKREREKKQTAKQRELFCAASYFSPF